MNQLSSRFYQISILFFLSTFFIVGCSTSNDSDDSTTKSPSYEYSITLDFSRVPSAGLDPVDVTVTTLRNDLLYAGQAPEVTLGKGSKNTLTNNGDGTYNFRITPTQTGEHPVTGGNRGTRNRGTRYLLSCHGIGIGGHDTY
ncbi:MAG: hypothetical protein GY786_02810 [Proteobacteria bacterium]|nr:hypothetical protein [Pseudomonadota bacterium]